jgi:hypothetical protein
MWGHVGDWPVQEPTAFSLDFYGFSAWRRIIRGWRRADARSAGKRDRIRSARTMLQCSTRELSSVRGISEWFPQAINDQAMLNLAIRGYRIWC